MSTTMWTRPTTSTTTTPVRARTPVRATPTATTTRTTTTQGPATATTTRTTTTPARAAETTTRTTTTPARAAETTTTRVPGATTTTDAAELHVVRPRRTARPHHVVRDARLTRVRWLHAADRALGVVPVRRDDPVHRTEQQADRRERRRAAPPRHRPCDARPSRAGPLADRRGARRAGHGVRLGAAHPQLREAASGASQEQGPAPEA